MGKRKQPASVSYVPGAQPIPLLGRLWLIDLHSKLTKEDAGSLEQGSSEALVFLSPEGIISEPLFFVKKKKIL